MRLFAFGAIAAIACASTTRAQTPCPAPAGFEDWARPVSIAAAADMGGAPAAPIVAGRAYVVALLPTAAIRYAVPPAKPGAAAGRGGVLPLDIARPGTYRIALGVAAWIDVLRGRTAISSTAHAHGPECTGVRKLVDFPLERGRYVLQISGAPGPTIAIEVAEMR